MTSETAKTGLLRRKNSGRLKDPRCLIGLHAWGGLVIDTRHCLRDCGARRQS